MPLSLANLNSTHDAGFTKASFSAMMSEHRRWFESNNKGDPRQVFPYLRGLRGCVERVLERFEFLEEADSGQVLAIFRRLFVVYGFKMATASSFFRDELTEVMAQECTENLISDLLNDSKIKSALQEVVDKGAKTDAPHLELVPPAEPHSNDEGNAPDLAALPELKTPEIPVTSPDERGEAQDAEFAIYMEPETAFNGAGISAIEMRKVEEDPIRAIPQEADLSESRADESNDSNGPPAPPVSSAENDTSSEPHAELDEQVETVASLGVPEEVELEGQRCDVLSVDSPDDEGGSEPVAQTLPTGDALLPPESDEPDSVADTGNEQEVVEPDHLPDEVDSDDEAPDSGAETPPDIDGGLVKDSMTAVVQVNERYSDSADPHWINNAVASFVPRAKVTPVEVDVVPLPVPEEKRLKPLYSQGLLAQVAALTSGQVNVSSSYFSAQSRAVLTRLQSEGAINPAFELSTQGIIAFKKGLAEIVSQPVVETDEKGEPLGIEWVIFRITKMFGGIVQDGRNLNGDCKLNRASMAEGYEDFVVEDWSRILSKEEVRIHGLYSSIRVMQLSGSSVYDHLDLFKEDGIDQPVILNFGNKRNPVLLTPVSFSKASSRANVRSIPFHLLLLSLSQGGLSGEVLVTREVLMEKALYAEGKKTKKEMHTLQVCLASPLRRSDIIASE